MKTKSVSPVRISSRPMPDHTQDWAWIEAHEQEYQGQWVMVGHGRLIAADPNLRNLLKKVPDQEQLDAMVWFLGTDSEPWMGYV